MSQSLVPNFSISLAMIRAPGLNSVLNGAALVRQILSRQNAFEEAVVARRAETLWKGRLSIDDDWKKMSLEEKVYWLLYCTHLYADPFEGVRVGKMCPGKDQHLTNGFDGFR